MKVFSIEKYCEDRGCAPSDFERDDWRVKSNGKTEEEMYRMGYVTSESWMVEEPSMLVFSEELYKKCVGKDSPLTSDDWAYGLDGRSKEDIESSTYYKIDDEWCYVKTPIERFEVGKWYRYNGSKVGESWNRKFMIPLLDNKPRLCTGVGVNVAKFEGVETHTCSGWYWGDLSLWEEVQATPPPTWKPKYGERVIVSDYSDFRYKAERIYIVQDGDKHVCFTKDSEANIDTRASDCTMRWKYVRQIPAKDKFKLAQEQVDNIKENLERLEYCLENKLEYDSRVSARFVQEALKNVMGTLKVEER